MATINQIRKSIESGEKNLVKFNKAVAMYETRLGNKIAKAIKETGKDVTEENYKETLASDA